MMTREQALKRLSLQAEISAEAVTGAYTSSRAELMERVSQAPTDGLRVKYREALDTLDEAYEVLRSPPDSPTPSLSPEEVRDLPAAIPNFTAQPGASIGQKFDLAPGTVLGDRYEIRAIAGRGATGTVYEAFDRLKGGSIALKLLHSTLVASDGARDRFVNELQIACSLSHPNIVKVFDGAVIDGHYVITMELLRGRNLREYIDDHRRRRAKIDPSQVVRLARQIGDALTYSHRTLVHRDLKPENIWITESGQIRLMDFGIARVVSRADILATGTALGTAYYLAPEQLVSAATVDARADQFSLAAICYEMLTGVVPSARMLPLSDAAPATPRAIVLAINRALESRPERRFPDVAAFIAALGKKRWGVSRFSFTAIASVTGAALILAAAFILGPATVRSIFPDRAIADHDRSSAIQSQAAITELLRRLDGLARRLEQEARDSRQSVERVAERISQSRNTDDRSRLARELPLLRQAAENAQEVQSIAARTVFESNMLVDLKADQALGESKLKEGDLAGAASLLLIARKNLEEIIANIGELSTAISARRETAALLEEANSALLQASARADLLLADAGKDFARSIALLNAGQAIPAKQLFQRTDVDVRKITVEALGDISRKYRAIAAQQLSKDELETAEDALSRARAIEGRASAFER